MTNPLQLISTDFDGTIHWDHASPRIALEVQQLLADLQAAGSKWVINTGRDLHFLREGLRQAGAAVAPDYVIVVEREIYERRGTEYLPAVDWNRRCAEDHATLYSRIGPELAEARAWINARFDAHVYEDAYSPWCLIAGSPPDAESIETHMHERFAHVPELKVMRNDIYARLSHHAYNKGTALSELAKRLGVLTDGIFAAGDHVNDLHMLDTRHARWIVAPSNAVPEVKEHVRRQGGHVSALPHAHAVAEGLRLAMGGSTAK